MRKRYLDEQKGAVIGDVWDDIDQIRANNKERIGYPTQKPEALLERIIKCATNEGDTVLDCFVGGGTTVAVADKLNRNWIGIDQSVQAIKVTEFRLNKQQALFSKPFTVQLHKYDYDTFAGSGTTLKVAHQLNRRWIGSEINPEYCQIISQRMQPVLTQLNIYT